MNGLVVNARCFRRRATGVETYARELASRLPGNPRLAVPPPWLSASAGHVWEQIALPAQISSGEALWSPANSGPWRVSRQALSLHDTFALDHPEWYGGLFAAWYRVLLPRLVRQVGKVLTVSEWSRQQILKRFPFLESRTGVIPAGVDRMRFYPRPKAEITSIRQRYGLPSIFLLFVGTLEPRKNLPRLLEAWRQVHREFPDAVLVLVGAAPRRGVHHRGLPENAYQPETGWQVEGRSHRLGNTSASCAASKASSDWSCMRFLGYTPIEDLPCLYSAARLLLLPSLAEGFGLPALEAMACGTPVVASTSGALPEIVGDAGLLVDPWDVSVLAGAIRLLLCDEDLRNEFRRRGLERASQFSWEESALQLSREMKEIAE